MSVQTYTYFSVVYIGLYLFSTRVLRLVRNVAANLLSFTHSFFVVLFLGLHTTYDLNIEYLRCVSMMYFVMDTIMFQVPKKSWAFTIHHVVSFILIQKYLNPYNPDVNNVTMEIFKHTYFWIELSNWPIYVVYDFHKYMQQYVHDIEQQLRHIKIYLILMQIELAVFGLIRGALFLYYVIINPVMDTFLYQAFVMVSIMSGYWYSYMLKKYNTIQVKLKHP